MNCTDDDSRTNNSVILISLLFVQFVLSKLHLNRIDLHMLTSCLNSCFVQINETARSADVMMEEIFVLNKQMIFHLCVWLGTHEYASGEERVV